MLLFDWNTTKVLVNSVIGLFLLAALLFDWQTNKVFVNSAMLGRVVPEAPPPSIACPEGDASERVAAQLSEDKAESKFPILIQSCLLEVAKQLLKSKVIGLFLLGSLLFDC